jgi:hypothetical protein
MKTWIGFSLAAVALALVPATASAGTITGKLPRKGDPMTVRVVRIDTGQVVAAKRLARPRYKLKLAAGPYMVFAGAKRRTFASRTVRVRRRGTRAVPMRRARAATTSGPELAVVAIDPRIEIAGVPGYPNGMALDTMLITDVFGVDCTNGGQVTVVEVRHRDEIEREIRLSNSKAFDPRTRIRPNFTKPDTFITGHGEVSGGMVTIDLRMTGKVTGSSSMTVPLSQVLTVTEALGSDLKGQICRSQDEPAPPSPPVVTERATYTGSLSGSATIPSLAGTTTETWSATDVRFSRTRVSSDSAPNYEITAGTLQFSVSGTLAGCTLSGSKAMPLAVAAGDAESTLDLAPDDSYFALGYPNQTLDVTYTCPDSDPFTMTYTAMNEFLRTNPAFQRRFPGPNGAIAGSAAATRDGKQLSWSWSLRP